jgi:NAD(P)-dependent dehydrogenase (short-subunit alcohol dehydrogenase family)
MPEFAEKVVVITGGGGGIGKAAAARFLDEGASVVLSSRRREVLEEARRELDADDRITLVPGDVSSPRAAAELIDIAVDQFGGVDVLVNSTGIFRVTPFLDQTEDQFEEALDSILRPTFYTSQAAVRRMVERGRGAIVSVGSMWAQRLLRRPGRPTRPDQEPGDRTRAGEHPRQYGGARVRRDARLPALHDPGPGPRRSRVSQRVPSPGPSRLPIRCGRGDPLPRQ